MNNPNPFLSQGVFLDQKNKARTRLKIAVYSSISLSVVVLMAGLLFQGCKKPTESADNGGGTSDSFANSQTQQLSNPQPETAPSNATALTPPAPESNPAPIVSAPPPVVAAPPPPVAEMQEYTIVKGDTYATIAKNNHISSSRAIMDVNPGVDPKKLKVGQKIKLPGATSTQSTSAAPMNSSMAIETVATGGVATYKVKSGDNLTTIAKKNHVSIKAIQSANNLGSSTSIKVGQVLKIPGTAAPAPAPEAAPVPQPVSAPAPVTTAPAPMH